MKRPIDLTAFAIMTLLCFIWGLQQSAIKLAAPAVDPLLQIGLRSSLAAALVLVLSRGLWRQRWLGGLFFGPGLVAGSLFGIEFLLVAEGLRWTSAAHMAVFLYTAPIFAAIGLHLVQPEERLAALQWLGVAVTFLGVAAIFLLPELRGGAAARAPAMILGDLLALAAGLAWGLTTVVVRSTRLAGAPPAQTLCNQLFVAGGMALAVSAATGRLGMTPGIAVIGNLAFQTVIVCTLSFLAWYRLLQIYPSSRLGVLSFMTPVYGVLAGAVLLGERLSADFLAGGGLVLVGMVIVQAQDLFARRGGGRAGPAPAP